jgi:hypothetical protein
MTIVDFLKTNGCPCFTSTPDEEGGIKMPDGRRVHLHPGIACHTTTRLVRGSGRRPATASWLRPWLRARRLSMRRTGKPPEDESITYVHCRGCRTTGDTTEHLAGAW